MNLLPGSSQRAILDTELDKAGTAGFEVVGWESADERTSFERPMSSGRGETIGAIALLGALALGLVYDYHLRLQVFDVGAARRIDLHGQILGGPRGALSISGARSVAPRLGASRRHEPVHRRLQRVLLGGATLAGALIFGLLRRSWSSSAAFGTAVLFLAVLARGHARSRVPTVDLARGRVRRRCDLERERSADVALAPAARGACHAESRDRHAPSSDRRRGLVRAPSQSRFGCAVVVVARESRPRCGDRWRPPCGTWRGGPHRYGAATRRPEPSSRCSVARGANATLLFAIPLGLLVLAVARRAIPRDDAIIATIYLIPYLVSVAIFGVWYEVRLLVPLIAVALPVLVAGFPGAEQRRFKTIGLNGRVAILKRPGRATAIARGQEGRERRLVPRPVRAPRNALLGRPLLERARVRRRRAGHRRPRVSDLLVEHGHAHAQHVLLDRDPCRPAVHALIDGYGIGHICETHVCPGRCDRRGATG